VNAYVRNKLAKRQAENATRSDALSILEELRQEAASGPEDVALIERNRRLINGTIDSDPVAPYREVTGADVQGRGIDGPFKKDSTIRLHTEYGKTNDPVLAPDAEQYGIRETGLRTEYLSPKGAQDLYRKWQPQQQAEARRRRMKPQDTANHFNRATAEYYGQQALKIAGMKPVADKDRSYNIRDGRSKKQPQGLRNHPNSTLGTDRLIETNSSILGGDVGMPAGDYRYYTPDGNIGVGDMQVATYEPGRKAGDAIVRLQALKGSKMTPEQEAGFTENIRRAASKSGDIDEALERMFNAGQLPQISRDEIKRYQDRPDTGMRAGKMTSDGHFMGSENFNDQHRYQHVLYGVQNANTQNTTLNAVPERYINVEASDARKYMNDNVGKMRLRTQGYKPDGSAYVMASLNDLLETGAATDLAEMIPAIRQLYI